MFCCENMSEPSPGVKNIGMVNKKSMCGWEFMDEYMRKVLQV